MLTIGSLFSGIGGLEYGLEAAGFGPVLWQCERDPYRSSVLARHWPNAARYPDVRALEAASLPSVALLCGGFPCQDVSSAGKKAGLAGARSGLWHEFARIAAGVRPEWIVVENVASGAALWVDTVRGDLERLGYESLPLPIAASDCGALHRRARIFIVAHAQGVGCDARHRGARKERSGRAEPSRGAASANPHDPAHDARSGLAEVAGASASRRAASWAGGEWAQPDFLRVVHGLPGRVDGDVMREQALGDSVVPQCAEVVGWVIRELMGSAQGASLK